ncbi:hypothetical protein V6N13_074938 [Hibiscus sabdariffa]|uniref:Uncharacterized protein n=1 Tax=Hibiscus sabdariffa TaxID=183260 RepID=A0ABR2U9Z8_9ROSI
MDTEGLEALVPRDCNHLADRIAALGRTTSRSGMVIADPPASLAALVVEEADRVLVDPDMAAWVRHARVDRSFWIIFALIPIPIIICSNIATLFPLG